MAYMLTFFPRESDAIYCNGTPEGGVTSEQRFGWTVIMPGVISMQTRTLTAHVVSDGFKSTVCAKCVASPHPAVSFVELMELLKGALSNDTQFITVNVARLASYTNFGIRILGGNLGKSRVSTKLLSPLICFRPTTVG
jgi:hypothetical protein